MDQRTEYVERLSAQMVEWDAQIDRLKDRAESAPPEARFEYSQAIAALQLKRDEAAVKLQGIAAAGDDEWEDLKAGTERTWGEGAVIRPLAAPPLKNFLNSIRLSRESTK